MVFDIDMLMDIQELLTDLAFILGWRQQQIDNNTKSVKNKHIDYNYQVGGKVVKMQVYDPDKL